jgi:hypothetical protein
VTAPMNAARLAVNSVNERREGRIADDRSDG